MLNLIRKSKSYDRRLSRIASPSAANIFLLQLNHFSSSVTKTLEPNSKDSNPEPFSAVYLQNEYGFSPQKALMHSRYLKFDSPEKPLSVVSFLKNHHFNDSQISTLVNKWPNIFRYTPESNYLPKIEFLRDLGFSGSEMVKILLLKPDVLDRSLENQIVPCVNFLRSVLHSDKDVMLSLLRYPGILREKLHNTLLPNVETLRGAGVPESNIATLLRRSPRRIAVDPEIFRSTMEEVVKVGLNPAKKTFIVALTVMRQLSGSTWKEKVECLRSWGWSEQQVMNAFRKSPLIMGASKDKICRILDFMMNTMGCDASVFMVRPNLLVLSFEKTIVPRCAFYQLLLSKGLMKQGSGLGKMLICPQTLFHKQYVQRFQHKCPDIFELYDEVFTKPKA